MSLEMPDKIVVLIIWMNAPTAIFIIFYLRCSPREASSRRGLSLKISTPDLYSDVHQALLKSEVSKQIIAAFVSMLFLESQIPVKEVKQLCEI